MTFFLLFIFGSVLGSFLNVLIDRLSTGRSFVVGRSYCEHCKKTLKTRDLIPIISYLYLMGRCRYCKTAIPFRIFVVELLSGILFCLVYFYGNSIFLNLLSIVFLSAILWAYLGIFFADLQYGIIPDLLVGISVVAAFFYVILTGGLIGNHVLAGIGALTFFLLLYFVTKGKGMGLGDVKLAFSMGFFLGFPLIVVSLYAAFLTGASVSIILIIWRKVRFYGGTIPFGPFLIFSVFFAFFFGNIVAFYFLKNFF